MFRFLIPIAAAFAIGVGIFSQTGTASAATATCTTTGGRVYTSDYLNQMQLNMFCARLSHLGF